jgi:hypothetical protein
MKNSKKNLSQFFNSSKLPFDFTRYLKDNEFEYNCVFCNADLSDGKDSRHSDVTTVIVPFKQHDKKTNFHNAANIANNPPNVKCCWKCEAKFEELQQGKSGIRNPTSFVLETHNALQKEHYKKAYAKPELFDENKHTLELYLNKGFIDGLEYCLKAGVSIQNIIESDALKHLGKHTILEELIQLHGSHKRIDAYYSQFEDTCYFCNSLAGDADLQTLYLPGHTTMVVMPAGHVCDVCYEKIENSWAENTHMEMMISPNTDDYYYVVDSLAAERRENLLRKRATSQDFETVYDSIMEDEDEQSAAFFISDKELVEHGLQLKHYRQILYCSSCRENVTVDIGDCEIPMKYFKGEHDDDYICFKCADDIHMQQKADEERLKAHIESADDYVESDIAFKNFVSKMAEKKKIHNDLNNDVLIQTSYIQFVETKNEQTTLDVPNFGLSLFIYKKKEKKPLKNVTNTLILDNSDFYFRIVEVFHQDIAKGDIKVNLLQTKYKGRNIWYNIKYDSEDFPEMFQYTNVVDKLLMTILTGHKKLRSMTISYDRI